MRKETCCRHKTYSFRLTARVLLYAPTIPDRIAHTTTFVTPVVEHWLEREIAQWVHPMKDRSDDLSHHERTLLPRSYISLPICSSPSNGSRTISSDKKIFNSHMPWSNPTHIQYIVIHLSRYTDIRTYIRGCFFFNCFNFIYYYYY